MRKLDGGLQALAIWVDEAQGSEFLIGNKFGLADIAIGSMLGWFTLRFPDHEWQTKYPQLKAYRDGLEKRKTFAETRPSPQIPKDKIV